MSATFNWAYRPGVSNKYGITIDPSADNVKPDNAVYVALFGNDITGNGSRQYPYRTIYKAAASSSGNFVIIGCGVYRAEIGISSSSTLIGDGDVVIDGFGNVFLAVISLYNISIRNAQLDFYTNSTLKDNSINGDNIVQLRLQGGSNQTTDNIFQNIGILICGDVGTLSNTCGYNTFVNIGALKVQGGINSGQLWFSIYENCNISFESIPNFDYCVFHKCKFSIDGGATYQPVSTIAALQSLVQTVYPSLIPFQHSIIIDALFNNQAIGDFTLALNSPAKNLSYLGTYVGAKSIALPINVSAIESEGEFEFASAVNVTINNNSITFTDPTIDAQIDTKVIVNVIGREIAKLSSYGFNADRNGQYIDSIPDLSTSVYNPGDALPDVMPFTVETGAIVYNSNTYQPGDRATTIAGAGSFSTSETGVIREILEAPERHTIMARFSDGGNAVAAGDALTDGNYYYVVSGTVSYNAVDQVAGTVFKASGAAPFTGAGSVIIAFSTESFQHYEPGIKPTSNNVGDSRTGAIIRGNGDPAYVRGGLGIQEFPINQKFIQIRYFIRANNLKP